MAARVVSNRIRRQSGWLCNYLHQKLFQRKYQATSWQVKDANRGITFETGKLAKLADGAVVVKEGETTVLATVVGSPLSEPVSYAQLSVDYRQKAAAAGRIPTNHLRRELGPTENEILTSRLIDRALRPIFPEHYGYQLQVMCNVLAVDGKHPPDVLCINAASAALSGSRFPWNGPVAAVRVGMIDNQLIINPTYQEQRESQLNIIIAGIAGRKTVMLEGLSSQGRNYKDLIDSISCGLTELDSISNTIKHIQSVCGKKKVEHEEMLDYMDIKIEIKRLAEEDLKQIFQDHKIDKLGRDNAIKSVRSKVLKSIDIHRRNISAELFFVLFHKYAKDIYRKQVMETKVRCDGRGLCDLRNINCSVDVLKPLHGSAMFQRGQTQVMCTVTFDSPDAALKLDPFTQITGGFTEKNFMLHYDFPAYAVNELSKPGVLKRREIGHGALAEKGLRPVLPESYPFTIRLTSEVMESNGSSSMASVCGGSLALIDAGVPLSEPVAGVAMGLITEMSSDNQIDDYMILTDIMGMEDYMGDTDFKLAGTDNFFTALQVDIKIPGLKFDIIKEIIERGKVALGRTIEHMNGALKDPRTTPKENAPVIDTINLNVTQRSRFIGAGSYTLKKLTSETGVRVRPTNGTCFELFAPNKAAMDEAMSMIDIILKGDDLPQLEFGAVYPMTIVDVKHHGVFLEIHPKLPLAFLPNNQLDARKVNHAEHLGFKKGDVIQVKFYGHDPVSGRIRLSRKVLQAAGSPVLKNLQS